MVKNGNTGDNYESYIQRNKGKSIRDPLYDYIPLSKVEVAIVDSPWLQRLRGIKQMGTTNRVYISANNTRFEHSLGVCHIVGEILESLDQYPDQSYLEGIVNGIEEEYSNALDFFSSDDIKTKKSIIKQFVRLIALLHDVGHGPFSHVSEGFLEVKPHFANSLNPHEVSSLQIMLKYIPHGLTLLLENESIDNTMRNTIEIAKSFLESEKIIKSIFIPNYQEYSPFQPLSMIINSQLDADKLDYLRRDAYATGSEFGVALDVQRIIKNMCTDEKRNYLCINKKALSAAESLVDSRYKAYRYIHTHHVKVQMDEILRRAIYHGLEGRLFELEKEGKSIKNPFNPQCIGKVCKDGQGFLHFKYGTLDDYFVIQRIREFKPADTSENEKENIQNSKYYLGKLEKRVLYKSPWKVSDPLTLIEEKVNQDDIFKKIIKKNFIKFIKELFFLNEENKTSHNTIKIFEDEIKHHSVLCSLHELISQYEPPKVPEELEERIFTWLKENINIDMSDISSKDIMVAHLKFDPYPLPFGEDKRKRIMLIENGKSKDLVYFSPEVRGFIIHWAIEKLFHGVYLFFSKKLYEKMQKGKFLYKNNNLKKLIVHLKNEFS